MDIQPIETAGILSSVTEKNSLIAFELFVIIGLIAVCKTLYNRNVTQGDAQAKALIDSTLALNNNTLSTNALVKEIENLGNKVNDIGRVLERLTSK